MKEIEIEVQLPAAETAVFLADKHVGQLLSNLLGNAIAYTPVGGKVSISAGEEWANPDHPIWFKITDNGVGIVPDDLPYVFTRFYRGALGREQQIPGTGLGLAICAEIVRRYQGDITIESEVGKGTSFTVFLPGTVLEGEGDDLA
ncbi:MAG: sensor histidine kinase [Chloroflexi bacterium]|nr:sensor histidine kinase [Chloroflexota bacterium]